MSYHRNPYSKPAQKKYPWQRVPLNVVNAERLLASIEEGEPVWRLFQDHKLYKRLEVYDYANEYAEPGYSLAEGQTGILFGNWNYLSQAGQDLLEQTFALEWSDEWSTCSGCCKCVRTNANDMSWAPSYQLGEGELICRECLACDPGAYYASVSWDENGEPQEHPSWSILHHLGIWEADKELPEGWAHLEDPHCDRYGSPDDQRTAEHFLTQGYKKVMLFKENGYEYKTILGYKDPDREEEEAEEDEG